MWFNVLNHGYASGDPAPTGTSARPTSTPSRATAFPCRPTGATAVPRIAHIGVGGFHRAHLAAYTHELAEDGSDWDIRGLGLLPGDAAMAAALHPQDCLYSLVEMGPRRADDGDHRQHRRLPAHGRAPDETVDLLADPDVAIVSMTITEAGYRPDVATDSTFDLLARARATASDGRRRRHDPQLRQPARQWRHRSPHLARRADAVAERLAEWIELHCSFPNSMVDRITPVTSEADRAAPRRARHRRSVAGRRRAVPPVGARGRLRGRARPRGNGSACCSPMTSTPGSCTSCASSTPATPAWRTCAPSPGSRSSMRRWRFPRCTASSACSMKRRCRH